MIDKQIHEETIKYLKTGQVTGAKAKTQKPRATKRVKTSGNPPAVTSSTAATVTATTNETTATSFHPPTNQSQTNHYEQQSSYDYQQANRFYNQAPTVQQSQVYNHYSHQPGQQQMNQQHHNYNQHTHPNHHPHHQHHQLQPNQQTHQNSSHMQPVPIRHPNDHHIHYNGQQNYSTQNNVGYYNHHSHRSDNFAPYPPNRLPTDLNFNLEAGLECDVDSLINYEMSMGSQLDFDHGLLLKLDNPSNHHL